AREKLEGWTTGKSSLSPLENAAGIDAGLTIGIRHVGSIAHQPTDLGVGTRRIGRGEAINENPARLWSHSPKGGSGGISRTLIGARRQVLWMRGSACETLWTLQGFLGSVRDFALFGLVLVLHPLHLLGKY